MDKTATTELVEPKTLIKIKTPWGDEFTEKERKEYVNKEWLFHVTPNFFQIKPKENLKIIKQ
jgi:hypothetical protein